VNKKYILKKINELSPWYQSINLGGVKTSNRKTSNIDLWRNIKSVLPKDLTEKKILDIGANAGYYSIKSALLGAEVTSVEHSNLACSQALFLKEYFESVYGNLNIKYIQKNINELNFDKLGKFDYIFALSILYHLDSYKNNKNVVKTFKNSNRIIKKITDMSDNIIIRTRNSKYNSANHYNKIFSKLNFNSNIVSVSGYRTLIVYEKQVF